VILVLMMCVAVMASAQIVTSATSTQGLDFRPAPASSFAPAPTFTASRVADWARMVAAYRRDRGIQRVLVDSADFDSRMASAAPK